MSDTLMATKEQEVRLILDGPQEIINSNIVRFRELNQKEAAEATRKKQEEARVIAELEERESYAKAFIGSFRKLLGINQDQLKEIIIKLNNDDKGLLEEVLLKKLKKRAIRAWGICSLLSIISISGFIFASISGISAIVIPSMLLAVGVGIPTLVAINSRLADNSPITSITFFLVRKRLKKKYGQNYFPHQELEKMLEISEPTAELKEESKE